jgi:PadR family transcriptional regulator PadR
MVETVDEQMLLILLDQWEATYKKGLLTFWLLLLLHQRPMYAFEMGQGLTQASQGIITADGKSLYRALRRFERIGLVDSAWQPSEVGPRRRYYHLTGLGIELLRRFVQRNLLIFQNPSIASCLTNLSQPLAQEPGTLGNAADSTDREG